MHTAQIKFSNFGVSDPVNQVIFAKPHPVRKCKYLLLITAWFPGYLVTKVNAINLQSDC